MDEARSAIATFADKPPVINALKTKKKTRGMKPIKIRIRLSEASTLTFKIQRQDKPKLVRFFKRNLPAGTSRVNVPRKIRKKLKPGKYLLTAVAKDSAGQISPAKRVRFKKLR